MADHHEYCEQCGDCIICDPEHRCWEEDLTPTTLRSTFEAMPTTTITKQGFKCARCAWAWVPRGDTKEDGPKVCPNCKRIDWRGKVDERREKGQERP